jgi:hypothetical protein
MSSLHLPPTHSQSTLPPSHNNGGGHQTSGHPYATLRVDTNNGQYSDTDGRSTRLAISGTPSQYTSTETIVMAPNVVPPVIRSVSTYGDAPAVSPHSFMRSETLPQSHTVNPSETTTAQRRVRTTTIGGTDVPTMPYTNSGVPPARFGSLLSLDPRMLASPSTKTGSVRQRRRRHDEYTSITDAINIEDIERSAAAGVSVTNGQATIAGVPHSASSPITDDALYSDEEHHHMLHPLHEGMQTEDDVDEEDESDVGGHDRLRTPFSADTDIGGPHEGSSADERAQTDTPTTTLRRAKPSFVRRQNTLLKEYEEEIGMPSGATAHSDGSDSEAIRDTSPSETEFHPKRRRESMFVGNEQSKTFPLRNETDSSKEEFINFLGISDKRHPHQLGHTQFSSASTEEQNDDPASSSRFEVTPIDIPPTQSGELSPSTKNSQ